MKLIKNYFVPLVVICFSLFFTMQAVNGFCSCPSPPFVSVAAPPNVMLDISVETPMQGAAHPDITCNGDPTSDTYGCSPATCRYTTESGINVSNCYDNTKTYYGYFDPGKCYTYVGDHFEPSGITTDHTCSGQWSGNFLNWATMTAIDSVRKAYTGGNRVVDTDSETVLLRAMQTLSVGHGWFPVKEIDDAGSCTPYTGKKYIINRGVGFAVSNHPDTDIYFGGRDTNPLHNGGVPTGTSRGDPVFVCAVKVCDPSKGLEDNCVEYGPGIYKPTGVIQNYAKQMRFGLIAYAVAGGAKNPTNGGVIRANMKWICPVIPEGYKYHDASGALTLCNTPGGCPNPEAEINPDGTFVANPDGAPGGKSGVINYLNQFGYLTGYKSYDPVSEMYYEAIRYFKNEGPTTEYTHFDDGSEIPATNDGFPVYCNRHGLNWRDPIIYPCQKNYIVALNDANPWLDKRLPGTYFTSAGDDNDLDDHPDHGEPSNPDPDINVTLLTNEVGRLEGINGTSQCIGCVPGDCDLTASDKTIPQLGEVMGTCPYPPKRNSYYIAGLAYYAHTHDLRPDLPNGLETPGTKLYDGTKTGNYPQTITTYVIDSQESNPHMLVGKMNMLYLAAKYGGYVNKKDPSDPTGPIDLTFNSYDEWDQDGDGFPDTYFFASDPGKMEEALNKAFYEISKGSASGTAVSVVSTSAQDEGKLFRAKFNTDIWRGYLECYEYNTTSGVWNSSPSWDAGEILHTRNLSSNPRMIYTATEPNTTTQQEFNTTNITPAMLDVSTDTERDRLVSFIRGNYVPGYRDRDPEGAGGDQWKLGDIVYSTPAVRGKPDSIWRYATSPGEDSYPEFRSQHLNRTPLVIVGANDGMVHAFNANNGTEEWAFIPNNLLGKLKDLSDPSEPFCHQYYVDLPPVIADCQVGNAPAGDHGWKTILLSGERAGGQAYFALDITDDGGTYPNGYPKPLWEFTDPNLGESWSVPEVKLALTTSGYKWLGIFGSGYNNGDTKGHLFGVDMADGSKFFDLTLDNATNNVMASPIAIDTNNNALADRVYIGDILGRMWKIVPNNGDTDTWGAAATLTASVLTSTGVTQPIRVRPSVSDIISPTSGHEVPAVFFGTGKYEEDTDKTTTNQQTFYCIFDEGALPITKADLFNATEENCHTLNGASLPSGYKGWYIDLPDPGERVTSECLIAGGIVFFTSFVPTNDICDRGGLAYLYAVKYNTGCAPDKPVLDVNGDNIVDKTDTSTGQEGGEIPIRISIGYGLPSAPVYDSKHGMVIVQTSDTTITATKTKLPASFKIHYWREIFK